MIILYFVPPSSIKPCTLDGNYSTARRYLSVSLLVSPCWFPTYSQSLLTCYASFFLTTIIIIIRCNYDFNWMWTSTPCELSCNTAQGGVGSTTSGYRVHLGFSGSAPPGPCQKPTSTPAAVCLPSTLFILVSPLIIRLPLAAFTPPSGNWPETLLKSARYFPYYLKQTADDVGSVQSCPISLATYL